MSVLYLDTETFCETPIKHGTHAYGEKAEVILTAYAWDDNPVDVLEEFDRAQIQQMIDDADTIVFHNSFFDRTVLAYNGVIVPIEKIEDTMVNAYMHALPGGLDELCEVLGVPADKAKKKTGKKLINLFCKPRPKNMKLRRATKATHPEEWAQFVDYAGFDIISMRECRKRTPRWNLIPQERKIWILDQKINDRGIKVDLDLANCALRAAARSQEELAARIDKLTDGKVGSATQRAKLLEHLEEEHELDVVDLKKGSVADMLKGKITDEVRELLEIRQQAAATSPAKYAVLLKGVSTRDNRLRGTLQYGGAARTLRWAGRLFQPQNLPRPTLRQELIDLGILAMLADCEDLIFGMNPDEQLKYGTVMDLCASAVRGALISEIGRKLIISDLSNIEGRVLAWLAGEDWKVKAFSEYDRGVGFDIYVLAYARAFGVTPEVVIHDKKFGLGIMRAIGKVMELACVAEGQQVLTDSGLRNIEDVGLSDRVWDGVEFVSHEGVIFRGEKEVGFYDNLEATPDHLVFIEGEERPIPFVEAAARGSRLAQSGSEGTPVRLGRDNFRYSSLYTKMVRRVRAHDVHGLWLWPVDLFNELNTRIVRRMRSLFTPTSRAKMVRKTMFGGVATVQQSKKRTVQILRRAWDNFRFFFADSDGRMGGGKHRFTKTHGIGPEKQRSGIQTGQSEMVDQERKHGELSDVKTKKTYDIRNAGPRNRFTANGRLVHNCGYGGGLGAFAKMASIYGVELSEEKITETVQAWRKSNSKIKSFWYDVEWAVRQALRNPGEKFIVGLLEFDRRDLNGMRWLRIKLPSGRFLSYPAADERDDGQIVYDGVNQYTHQWGQIETYGPKFVENIVQAVSRDILAFGMLDAEDAGYEICMHAHDEQITEADDNDEHTAEGLSAIMAKTRSWTIGLPLAAAGFETYRYRKDQS